VVFLLLRKNHQQGRLASSFGAYDIRALSSERGGVMRRGVIRGLAGLAGALAIASVIGQAPSPVAAQPRRTGVDPSRQQSPIKHVVIFFQENHSFDNVLGRFCASTNQCDGATEGQLANGQTIPLATATDVVPSVRHLDADQATAIAGGAMNGFSKITGCRSTSSYACYSQFDPSQIPNLTQLAGNFAVSDRTFALSPVPSFGAHVELVAQQLDGFTGDNPVTGAIAPSAGWGCDSNKDAPWRSSPSAAPILVPACVPTPQGSGPYRNSPVQWVPTIMDRLDAAGLHWRFYAAPANSAITRGGNPYNWAICPIFESCLDTIKQGAANVVPTSQVISDAGAGRLPSFSILLPENGPSGQTSQHNGASMMVGDNWIGQVLTAIANGPDWSSTAVFITYDDCGCFYDHVAPPAGLGIRVPMVIVSPFAKRRFTDSKSASFASMLAFTEHLFGLDPLTDADAHAYDYSDSFNFSQGQQAPPRLVQQAIPPAEASYLTHHPPDPNDPT
jgi:phospholipase C